MPSFKISPEVRKKIIEKLLTSPERKTLWETVKSKVEEVVSRPKTSRAYMIGSFPTKKLNPSDVDILYKTTPFEIGKITDEEWIAQLRGKKSSLPLHTIPTESMKNPFVKELKRVGIERHGLESRWIRIASLLAALKAMGAVKNEANKSTD